MWHSRSTFYYARLHPALELFVAPSVDRVKNVQSTKVQSMASSPRNDLLYENALFGILQNEGQIVPFLDVVFQFLYRRTDFYRIMKNKDEKCGFPPGVSEDIVLKVFKKYQRLAAREEQEAADDKHKLKETSRENDSQNVVSNSGKATDVKIAADSQDIKENRVAVAETKTPYNGAVRDRYSWSQTINDLDVYVKVPSDVVRGKSVHVELGSMHLKVTLVGGEGGRQQQQECLVDDDLVRKVNVEKSIWTLVPGEHVHINYEKVDEYYWDGLLVSEPKIDTHQLDCVKPMEDLPEDEQAKIDELMYNEQQKRLGKPTSEQMKIQDILKEAWDKEGSPFRGQPFDPSVVNIGGTTDDLSQLRLPAGGTSEAP